MKHIAIFERFSLELSYDQALQGSHQGACDSDIAELLQVPEISDQFANIQPSDIAKELSEYGVWDDIELQDQEANKARILWIACGNIKEDVYEMEKESKR